MSGWTAGFVRIGIACTVTCHAGAQAVTAQGQASVQAVDASGLYGKHIVGYQGWFGCPEFDGQWMRWFKSVPGQGDAITVDLWPDTAELSDDERCRTGLRDAQGHAVYAYTTSNAATVDRHFRWMHDYGIDGAAVQRFLWKVAPAPGVRPPVPREWADRMLVHAMHAAEAHGRVFMVDYDISGPVGAGWAQRLLEDWRHLNQDLHITDSPAYLHHRGRPLLGVWGLGFTDRVAEPAETLSLIASLKSGTELTPKAAVMGGVPTWWRTLTRDAKSDPAWQSVYAALDVISPWTVGRYLDADGFDRYVADTARADLAWADAHGVDYLPVVFPGLSNANQQTAAGNPRPPNRAPRACGRFYGHQLQQWALHGARMIYTAMFDEVDEGTAIYKLIANQASLPVGSGTIALDADGCTLPDDFYLKQAGQAGAALKNPHDAH